MGGGGGGAGPEPHDSPPWIRPGYCMLGYGWEFPPDVAVKCQALVDRTGTRVYIVCYYLHKRQNKLLMDRHLADL